MRNAVRNDRLTIGELIAELGERTAVLATIFLCSPFLTPVPTAGLSTPFGAVVAALGVSLALGRPIRLPRRWMERRISPRQAAVLMKAAEVVVTRALRWARPRGKWATHPLFEKACGAGIVLCGLALALPLPPGGNAAPSFAAILFAVAAIAGDGVLAVLAMLLTIVTGGLVAFLAYAIWSIL